MSPSRESPNPLRPYYIPPSVGSHSDPHINTSTASNVGSKHASIPTATNSFGSSARNILADMDYSEYIDASPSNTDIGKQLVEQALWKYLSVFLAQPFEVAKTVLQVQHGISHHQISTQARAVQGMRKRPSNYRDTNDLYGVSCSLNFRTRHWPLTL